MTYEQWKLQLIRLILDEKRIKGTLTQKLTWKFDEIECVLNGEYEQAYRENNTPEEAWQGEIDAIYDSQ